MNIHPNEDAIKTARNLSDFVNGMGNRVEDIVAELKNEHRTLQQGITKFCVKWLEQCAKNHDDNLFDLRNEASCKLGKAFVDRTTVQERALPFI